MDRRADKSARARARSVFLEHLERTGDYRAAALVAGVSERTGRNWRKFAKSSGEPWQRPTKTNLVAYQTSFVGRNRELDAMHKGTDRLLTITGPPGVGKTRLTVEFGLSAVKDYGSGAAGGVWYCDLTETRELGSV